MMNERDVGEEGGRVDTLSLAECYIFDPKPAVLGKYFRFYCPLHGGDNRQSLRVNKDDGKFKCFTCERWGTVTEHKIIGGFGPPAVEGGFGLPREPPPLKMAEPMELNPDAMRWVRGARRKFRGSPAQEYARQRGIPDQLMKPHFMGYRKGTWGGIDSEWLTFPLRCPMTGVCVSVYGRNLHTNVQLDKSRIFGKTGLFGATETGPMPEDVIVVEGVFEALAILNTPGLPPPRALIGVAAQAAWFDSCRRVTIMLDDDQAGQGATDRLVKEFAERRERRGEGPQVLRLRPQSLRDKYGVKDLGDLLAQGLPVKIKLPVLS